MEGLGHLARITTSQPTALQVVLDDGEQHLQAPFQPEGRVPDQSIQTLDLTNPFTHVLSHLKKAI